MVFCTGGGRSGSASGSASSVSDAGRRSTAVGATGGAGAGAGGGDGVSVRDSVASLPLHRVVLPHGDPIFRAGWLRIRFKPLSRSVPRYCTLTGACFKHSATPSGEILTDGFDIFGAKVVSDDFSSHAVVVRAVGGARLTLIAESRHDVACWLRDLTRAACRSIVRDYQYVRELRAAGIGKQLLACDRDVDGGGGGGRPVAVKLTSKRTLSPKYIALARAEAVTLLSLAHHPHILAIRDIYESARNIYLVTEYVCGHTLGEVMDMRGSVGEADVAAIMRDLFSALEHMHLSGAVHRLCAPGNVVLVYGDGAHKPIVGAKLCNLELTANVFDLATAPPLLAMLDDGTLPEAQAAYVAPEVARGGCGDCAQDMWAMGALMQYMLTATTPYSQLSGTRKERLQVIARGERPLLSGPRWRSVTAGARQLCARLLEPNPAARINATQALEDAWITLK